MSASRFKFVSPGIFVNEIDNSQLPAATPQYVRKSLISNETLSFLIVCFCFAGYVLVFLLFWLWLGPILEVPSVWPFGPPEGLAVPSAMR